jgi:hypothetical protein
VAGRCPVVISSANKLGNRRDANRLPSPAGRSLGVRHCGSHAIEPDKQLAVHTAEVLRPRECKPDELCRLRQEHHYWHHHHDGGNFRTGGAFRAGRPGSDGGIAGGGTTFGRAHEGGGPKILETGYSQLEELGTEQPGYGLYSYAILVDASDRSAAFVAEVFKFPPIAKTGAKRSQLNIFYLPIKPGRSDDFVALSSSTMNDPVKFAAEYSKSLYDYKLSRTIVDHVCNAPTNAIRDLCQGPMSKGPYILTYAKPASSLEPVPPPYLFVDLSDVNQSAFPEFMSAFREQVKQQDVTDGAKLHSLRLEFLTLVLTTADWISPVKKTIADIVHLAK